MALLVTIGSQLQITTACAINRASEFLHYWQVCHTGFIGLHKKSHGYGSIPIDTFLGEWTSIYQLFWCSPGVQGFDTHPHVNPYPLVKLWKITFLNGWINYKWQFPIAFWCFVYVYQRAMLLMLICVSWYLKILLRGTSIIAVPSGPLGLEHLRNLSVRQLLHEPPQKAIAFWTSGIQVPNISRVIFGVVHPISACKGSKGKGITPMPKFHSKNKNNNVFLSGMSVSLLATKKMWTCLPSIHSLLQHLRFHRWTNDGTRRSSHEACMTGILTGIPKHLNYSEPQGPS